MYPKLPPTKESFINEPEHFLLTSNELNIIHEIKNPINQLGFTILLKSFQYLGYFPNSKEGIPNFLVEFLASQLEISPDYFKQYNYKGRSRKYHVKMIRDFTGFKPYNNEIVNQLTNLILAKKEIFPSRNNIAHEIIIQLRQEKMELLTEKKFSRLVNLIRKQYYNSFYKSLFHSLGEERIKKLYESLYLSRKEEGSYDCLKRPAGKAGLNTILIEINKLNCIQDIGIDDSFLKKYSPQLIEQLYRSCRSKDASRLKGHSKEQMYSIYFTYLFVRQMGISDGIIKIFLELIKRIEKKSDKHIENDFSSHVRESFNKLNILKKLTLAITGNPSGSIETVILSQVDLETLKGLANEFKGKREDNFNNYKASIMKQKYTVHYRRMMKPIFNVLEFKSNNPKYKDLLLGIKLLHKYLDTKHVYYPEEEEIPHELLKGKWEKIAVDKSEQRVIKHYFELCVLEKMEKTLKCKEIWIEESKQFQNPDKDLPKNWKERRTHLYDRLNLPIEVNEFIEPIKEDMSYYLKESNQFFSREREDDVFIFHPAGGKKGFFRVPKIKRREERPILKRIHKEIKKKWGIVDLLDVLTEADRRIHFSRFFYTSAQREILTEEQIKERLLLIIFSLGTNIGLKRIYKAANPDCEYEDLLYFKNRYLNPDSLREAIIALTNTILKIRNPFIWGETTSCASDGKQFGSWDQNLMADSNPHYRDPGVMVYWHIDRNAACIYSQLRNCNSSEIYAMVEGLIRHATTMTIRSNYVDSRGQSEIAFAFCHLLGINLMPRLKRIKYQTLYVPTKDMTEELSHLKGVLNRPIRWKRIIEQYDEMVKYVSAIVEKPELTESILRRFTSYNRTHPTYKAFLELGRACKTIFLCKYLTLKELRLEVFEGLNLIESWNSVNNFICFGTRGEFGSNDPYMQEMIILCLHLLQNSMILTNTIMIDKVIDENNLLEFMTAEDRNSLNPLSTGNYNPYGSYNLVLDKPSFLEVA